MVKFLLNHFMLVGFGLAIIIGCVAYYFQVVRWEKKQLKKRMQDTFWDTKKFKQQHKN